MEFLAPKDETSQALSLIISWSERLPEYATFCVLLWNVTQHPLDPLDFSIILIQPCKSKGWQQNCKNLSK